MPLIEHLMEKWCIAEMVDPEQDDGYASINADLKHLLYHLQIEKLIDDSGYVSPLPSPDRARTRDT